MMPSQPVSTALGAGSPAGTVHTSSRAEIAAHQLDRLRAGLGHVLAGNRFYQRKLAGYDVAAVESLDAVRPPPLTNPTEPAAHPPAHRSHRTELRRPLLRLVR